MIMFEMFIHLGSRVQHNSPHPHDNSSTQSSSTQTMGYKASIPPRPPSPQQSTAQPTPPAATQGENPSKLKEIPRATLFPHSPQCSSHHLDVRRSPATDSHCLASSSSPPPTAPAPSPSPMCMILSGSPPRVLRLLHPRV